MPEILQHDFTEGEVHDSTRLEITKESRHMDFENEITLFCSARATIVSCFSLLLCDSFSSINCFGSVDEELL